MRDYKYEGETFKLDDSKGCYVSVIYKRLKQAILPDRHISGTVTATAEPYFYYVGGDEHVATQGLTSGNQPKRSAHEVARGWLCAGARA